MIECNNKCKCQYIGETKCQLNERFRDFKPPSTQQSYSRLRAFQSQRDRRRRGGGGGGKVRKEKDLRRGSLFPSLPNPLSFSFFPSSLCPFDASHSGHFKIKRTKAHTTSQRPNRPEPIPISSASSMPKSIVTPHLDGILVHRIPI